MTRLPPTATVVVTRIHAIQGQRHLSPLAGQTVTGVTGIVTSKRQNGFYLQDPTPDGDNATSEGVFVFTMTEPRVAVGDAVMVSGRVGEFRPGGTSGTTNLTLTQLEGPTVDIVSHGNPLPTPVVIGQGGRLPPSEIIASEPPGDVEQGGNLDPLHNGLDFYESLEGMLVEVDDAVVVGPRSRFGEIVVVADDGVRAGLRTGRGGVIVRPTDYNPERLYLDDELLRLSDQDTPVVNVGDHFARPVVGVMDYSFGAFKIQLTTPVPATAAALAREAATPPGPGQISLAGFNVENLDPTDVAKFEPIAQVIVNQLRSPDILTVEEIQDNNGRQDDRVVDAGQTYTRLIEAIQGAGGPTYEVRQLDPVDDQDGGEPGGNIRQGFLFRTDRGVQFVDRAGGTATTGVSLDSDASGVRLSFSPGRIDPTNPAWANSRKPLVGEFQYNGQTLFVVGNHLIAKSGDQPLFGRFQPPALPTERQRLAQTQVLSAFVRQVLSLDPAANIVLLGDLNDFEFSAPLKTLTEAGLQNLTETLPPTERYSYVFEGNSQALDHILVSEHLAQTAQPEYDVVHVNAEYAERVSDHDPAIVRLTLLTAPRTGGPAPIPWTEAARRVNQTVQVEGTIITTRNTGRVTYLNFSRNFNTDLKIVIFPREAALFPRAPESMYQGQKIRVTGKIELYQGAPEIIVRDPSQIAIIP